jgi:PTS system fructose-specific IIB component
MKVIAITSCPTGIAHSQMAAENLEQTAEKLGHEIRVEIQGAMGAENELNEADLAEADAAIIAADTAVNRDRFEEAGVPVVKGTVKDAINDPESLFDRAQESAGVTETETEVETAASEPVNGETKRELQAEGDTIPEGQPIGGDPRKSLIARLKRLFA